jgi:hypothetical protein
MWHVPPPAARRPDDPPSVRAPSVLPIAYKYYLPSSQFELVGNGGCVYVAMEGQLPGSMVIWMLDVALL